jgi:hypothetical protein
VDGLNNREYPGGFPDGRRERGAVDPLTGVIEKRHGEYSLFQQIQVQIVAEHG